jgi:hypothetical protein
MILGFFLCMKHFVKAFYFIFVTTTKN